jgi:cell division protein FtsW
MGEQTAVNSRFSSVRAVAGPRPLRLGIDVPLVLSVAFLLGFGLLMVYSASWQPSMLLDKPTDYYFVNQLRWAGVGLLAGAFFMYVDYRRWRKLVVLMMLVMIALLIVVLIFGETRYNSRRTLFNGSIQPSELAKLAVIIYLSFWLYAKRENINKITIGLVPMVFILGMTSGLIMLQPDLSATITILALGGLLFFLAGVDIRQIVLILLAVTILGGLFLVVSKTGHVRMEQYIQGLQDPTNASYHIKRSIESIVNGGVFGVGIGNGTTKFGLPVSHTDSIFAVIAEETGLVGAAGVLIAFMVFMWRGLKIASRAPDMVGKLLASGLTLWIAMEALLNMGVMVSIFPFAGNALPFISAGGSNLTMTMAAVGLILSVARVSNNEKFEKEGKSFGAVINLRRGNGRRRVSRANRSSGTRA